MKLLSQYLSENNNYKILRLENYLLGWHDKAHVDEHISLARETVKKHNIIFYTSEHTGILLYPEHQFVGFENILQENYNTKKWMLSTPGANNFFGDKHFLNQDNTADFFKVNKELYINHNSKIKDFLFLNGKSTPARVKLAREMKHNRLLDNSVWSFNDAEFKNIVENRYEWPAWQGKHIDFYCAETRMVHAQQYSDTICSVIAETLNDNDIHYISEKTFKSLAAGHLFVVLSGAGFLKNLQARGFKTFSDFFDESYDAEFDLEKRIAKIISTLKHIKSCDYTRLYQETESIRKHNQQLMLDTTKIDSFNKQQYDNITNYFLVP